MNNNAQLEKFTLGMQSSLDGKFTYEPENNNYIKKLDIIPAYRSWSMTLAGVFDFHRHRMEREFFYFEIRKIFYNYAPPALNNLYKVYLTQEEKIKEQDCIMGSKYKTDLDYLSESVFPFFLSWAFSSGLINATTEDEVCAIWNEVHGDKLKLKPYDSFDVSIKKTIDLFTLNLSPQAIKVL